jgi:hypothetical protein
MNEFLKDLPNEMIEEICNFIKCVNEIPDIEKFRDKTFHINNIYHTDSIKKHIMNIYILTKLDTYEKCIFPNME